MSHSSEDRLWQLIESRREPGADIESIDRTIWEEFGDERAVIFTDLAGFSRRVAEFGIIHFLGIIHEQRALFGPHIVGHGGTILKEEADSMLIDYPDASSAFASAVAMQRACERVNVDRKPEDQILLCLGIGTGQVLRIADHDVHGPEVNAASKLGEDTATAGEILVTEAARLALGDREDLGFERLEDVEIPGTPVAWRIDYSRVE